MVVVGCSLSLRGANDPGAGGNGTPTPLNAGGPPSVEIASPANGSTASTGQTLDVDVRGSDPWSLGVARLELFAAGELVDRAVAAGGANRLTFGAILEWIPLTPGSVELSALAYRADGTASLPAVVTVVVTGNPISAPPSFTPIPLPTATPTFSTPSPSPTPTTAPPTASPTPAPIGVHVDVWVDEADVPDWTAGQASQLIVHVQNIGAAAVPFVRIVASLAGSTVKARTGSLRPGQETTIAVSLKPGKAGQQKLSVVGKLPAGYVDTDPSSNTLVWERIVTVSPAATPEPTPTPEPTLSPSPPPTP